MPITNRTLMWGGGLLLLIATACASLFQLWYILLVPPGLLLVFLLMQHPSWILYGLMISIPWSIEYNFTPSLGTDLPDEPLMVMGAFAAIIFLLSGGIRKHKEKWLHPLVIIVLLQFIWSGLTIITSTEKLLSVKFQLAKSWYLLVFVALPFLVIKDQRFIRRLAGLLAISMMAFACYALVRHQQYNFTFEMINTALEPFYRNHVNYSALLVFTVPIQIAAIQLTASRNKKIFLLMVLVICLAALYFSFARGAWLALVAAIGGYWLIRKKLLVWSFALFMFASLGTVIWLASNDQYLKYSHDYKTTVFHTNFREHLAATYAFKDASTAERFYRWIAGVRMASDRWETGFGPSSFYRQYRSYTIPAFKTWVSGNPEQSTVHNYFLLQFLEQGAMGFLLFVLLVGTLFGYAQKIYHRTNDRFWKIASGAIAAILIMECVVNSLSDMIETDKAGSVFYLCLAILVIGDIHTRRKQAKEV